MIDKILLVITTISVLMILAIEIAWIVIMQMMGELM